MSDKAWLLLIGAGIGLVSSLIGAFVNHFLSLRAERIRLEWVREENESIRRKRMILGPRSRDYGYAEPSEYAVMSDPDWDDDRFEGPIDDADDAYAAYRDYVNDSHGYDDSAQIFWVEEPQPNEEALTDYDQAIALNPEDATAYNNRGIARHTLGQHEEAIADYDQAIALFPDGPDKATAYNSRGRLWSVLGRHEDAIADYDQAIALNPEYALAYKNRGNARSALAQHEDAIADYDQVIALFPDGPDKATAYSNRGIARHALGRHQEAIADYDQAIALFSDSTDKAIGYYNIACAYAQMADPKQALPYLRRALAFNSDEYCQLTADDTAFDAIRDQPGFQALVAEFCSP